jgi:hypothetical protein
MAAGAEDTGVAEAMAMATDTAMDMDMAATDVATVTGMAETGTDTVAAAGGMVAGGHMGWAPVGHSGPVAGSGFATERDPD